MKLGELINTRKQELGTSYDRMAARAQAEGYGLTKATLSTYATSDLTESPKRRTMEALASALGVSFAEVVLAVSESLIGGNLVEVANHQHVSAWLTLTSGRSDEEIASLLRVVRTMSAALDVAHGAGGDAAAGSNGRAGDDG